MNQQCSCGNWAVEKTSWIEYNPGRRFLTCVNGRCNFFRWNEPEFDACSKSVINGLLRRLKNKDDEHFAEMIKAKDEYQHFYKEELTETQNEAAIYKEKMSELKKESRQWKFVCVCYCCCTFSITGLHQLVGMKPMCKSICAM